MATETWNRIAVPLLEHFANHEVEFASRNDAIELRGIAEAEDLDVEAAEVELDRLFKNGYLEGGFHPEFPPGSSWMIRPKLTVKGARAAGIWPPDEAAEAFQAIIDRRLAEAETPEDRRFWRKIKDSFAGVPAGVIGALATEVAKSLAR
jgi:hypothetical protein